MSPPRGTRDAGKAALIRAGHAARGLELEAAAAYVGVSRGHFERMIRAGVMPAPRVLGERRVWCVLDLDAAFDRLPRVGGVRAGAPGRETEPGGDARDVFDDVRV